MRRRQPLAGEIFLRRLKAHGVDYLFANGGTDFAPVIEGLMEAAAAGADLPQAVVIPHESAAVAMAHGYYLATGRPQAVMMHTNVGLANAVMGAINAAAEAVPIFLCSGRTPVSESGHLGSRTAPINWGQDMRDQNAMLREAVKWDFTLHYADQTAALVDRAMTVATSAPKGPVYMSLPREALSTRSDATAALSAPLPAAARPAPFAADVEKAAALLLAAQNPLIISHDAGGGEASFQGMRRFAEAFAIPVVDFWASRLCMATDSPMHAGFDVAPELAQADVVLVINALVPWLPLRHGLRADLKVIQTGPDPHHGRFPVRGFPADVALTGDGETVIAALHAAMAKAGGAQQTRFSAIAARGKDRRQAAQAQAAQGSGSPMSIAWISACLSHILDREDGIVVSELGVEPSYMEIRRADRYFGHPISGGLGWGLPAALGLQLADRKRLVVATVGDGAYMFANPVACHQVAEALDLPILTLVFNNGLWNAVRKSTLDIFPAGLAAKADRMPLTSLEPSPDYCMVAQASRAWTKRVDTGTDLPAALQEAVAVIRGERRQALIELRTRQ